MNSSYSPISIIVAAPAKVNWYLELLHKRDDGFHQIETFMSTISLYDTLTFTRREDNQLRLLVQQSEPAAAAIPTGPENLVHRAALAMQDRCQSIDEKLGVDIVLQKRIPSAAGLGGASSDAAATIMALNKLWGVGLGGSELQRVASTIGSDVPFFLFGGTAFCEGRGEKITSVSAPVGQWIVVGKPATGLSTPEVYSRVTISNKQHKAADFESRLKTGRAERIGDFMHNRLQGFAMPLNDEIEDIKNEFQLLHDLRRCCGHQLSGSGSSYFGLFASHALARKALSRLQGRLPGVSFYCCRTIGSCGLSNSEQGALAA